MIGLERIYNIFVEILGESKQGGYDSHISQYQFNCPACAAEKGFPDNKYNLEVSFKRMKYNCWSCGESNGTRGNLSKLIKKYGNSNLLREYRSELSAIKESKLYDISAYNEEFSSIEDKSITLPKTFKKINIKSCNDRRLKEYLNKRKISQDIVDKFNLGYTSYDEEESSMRNRLIIPSYDQYGDLNYWTARDFTNNSKRVKYKNVDADRKQIIFQESLINWDADIYLVEGVIDCLYFPNTIALMSKVLKKDSLLFQTLIKKCNANIIVILDGDTDIIETKKIYSILNVGRMRNKIKYVRLDKYKDFGEIYEMFGKRGIINTIKKVNIFKEIELLF